MGQAQLCRPTACAGECLIPGSTQSFGLKTQGAGVAPARHHRRSLPNEPNGFESDSSDAQENAETLPRFIIARQRVFSAHLRSKVADFYSVGEEIGEGSYGTVYKALVKRPGLQEDEHFEGLPVALKCFKDRKSSSSEGRHSQHHHSIQSQRRSFERERGLLAHIEHPHIVRMFECFDHRDALWIVLEYCAGGELYDRLVQQHKETSTGFPESLGRMYFRQMCCAVNYLRNTYVIHRDVKTENFLLLGDPGTSEDVVVKLCDFGTGIQLGDPKERAMETMGTLSYTAPEIYNLRGASLSADDWSLGVVLYVILVGSNPFRTSHTEPRDEALRRIKAGRFDTARPGWQNLSKDVRDLIQRLLTVDETERLTSREASQHSWVHCAAQLPSCEQVKKPDKKRRFLTPLSSRYESIEIYAQYAETVQSLIERFSRLDTMQRLSLIMCARVVPDIFFFRLNVPVPWYDLFFALDQDEDGRLCFSELKSGLKTLLGSACKPDNYLSMLIADIDVDSSGWIEWVEWTAVALLSVPVSTWPPEVLAAMFRLLDRPSGDGLLGAADMLAVLNSGPAGAPLSCDYGRAQVLNVMRRWESKERRRWRRQAGPVAGPPAMDIQDLQNLLHSACSGRVARPPSTTTARANRSVGFLACCAGEADPVSQEVHIEKVEDTISTEAQAELAY